MGINLRPSPYIKIIGNHSSSTPKLRTYLLYLFHLVPYLPSSSISSNLACHYPLWGYIFLPLLPTPTWQLPFCETTIKKFFNNIRSPHQRIIPQWSLQTVLNALIRPPFEPISSSSLQLLTCKTAFLVAITSAKRASELSALRCDPPFTQFHPDKVTLYFDVSFLPKMVSDFHINQPIILPSFFKSPLSPLEHMLHTLDVRRALSLYLDRTKSYRRSNRLFICFHGSHKGAPASSQSISRCIVYTISLAYKLLGKSPPEHRKAHSTRALSTSVAFQHGTEIPDICRAATWSTPSTFVNHYQLDLRARQNASFSRAVLASFLPWHPTCQ